MGLSMTTNPINIIGNKLSINKKQKWPFFKLRASFLETGKATIPHINNNLHSEPKDICAFGWSQGKNMSPWYAKKVMSLIQVSLTLLA
jgi:hypothetical protein